MLQPVREYDAIVCILVFLLQVHQGVEQRVKEALARAEHLEQQQEQTAKQTAEQLAALQQQQSDLEAALQQERELVATLQQELHKTQAAGEHGLIFCTSWHLMFVSRPGYVVSQCSTHSRVTSAFAVIFGNVHAVV